MIFYRFVITAILTLVDDTALGHGVFEEEGSDGAIAGNHEGGDHKSSTHGGSSPPAIPGKGGDFLQDFNKQVLHDVDAPSPSLPLLPISSSTSPIWNYHAAGMFEHRDGAVTHADVDDKGERNLVDLGMSSWDGWKFIKPNTDPNFCLHDSGHVSLCSTPLAPNDENNLWMHDEEGRLFSKNKKKNDECLTANSNSSDEKPYFASCDDSDVYQMWTRKPNGQFLNEGAQKFLSKAVCGEQESLIILQDDSIGAHDRCDLFSVIGPHIHDSKDFGNVFFHQLGNDLSSGYDDDLFASSVSIDDNGKIVAIGASTPVGGEYAGTVTIFIWSGDIWIEKVKYQLDSHKSYIKPKVTVAVSGDAKKVAIATSSTNNEGLIQVLNFDEEATTLPLTPLGSLIEGESTGELPGLKISIDKYGNTLVIGSPYFDVGNIQNAGRVRIFTFDFNQNDYVLKLDIIGVAKEDRLGSAVSISSDGDLIAYGTSGADLYKNNSGSSSVMKLINNEWIKIGDVFGEAERDESGFSVKVVKIVDEIRLVVGAIFNNGNNQINSGHVRVYKCDFDNCQESWTQIGSDIDGDNGVVFSGDSFHVGDALGFSLDMSEDGKRLVLSSPFHSASRASDYYSGSVKMFELSSITDDWEQLGHDLIGDGTTVLSGYSVGLSRDGKTLVVGSPGEPSGSAQVYLQDEVSNRPSLLPSALPTSVPSLVPSSSPTSSTDRPFQIQSTYSRFDMHVVDVTNQTWCIEAKTGIVNSILNMRPCDRSSYKQVWMKSDEGKIYLQDRPQMAISYERRKLWLKDIDNAPSFIINGSENSISVTKNDTGKTFYIGIDPFKVFSRLRLYQGRGHNQSLFSWQIHYFGPSSSPSMTSQAPTGSRMDSSAPSVTAKGSTTTIPTGSPIMQSPTTASPSAFPVPCQDNPNALFYWKTTGNSGNELFKSCSWLNGKPGSQDNACGQTNTSNNGIPPAKEVCCCKCDTCSG